MVSSNGVAHEPFSAYRARVAAVIQKLTTMYPREMISDQCVGGYLEGLPLSRWVFWKRLSCIAGLLPAGGGGTCVDFGCGLGVMLPLLGRRFTSVYGVDMEPDPSRQFLRCWESAYGEPQTNVSIHADLASTGLGNGSVDLIVALDVLEHVHDLDGLLETMLRLLSPRGLLLVSGPTETWIYKLGRRIVGFSNHTHLCNVSHVRRAMEKCFAVRTEKRLFYPFTLFELMSATRKPVS
jgi:2-polyprenyl-3-methyl-5-hydroxy-6-metoxy-1,4-benzoquinol methylase